MHTPSRSEAHLLVAAIRVLEHQHKRPPAVDEIAALLGFSKEFTGHLVRVLEPLGIVHAIKSAFDVRVEVREYTRIEELSAEERGPGFKEEVDEFHRQFEEKQRKLQSLFDSGEQQDRKAKRLQNLDEELHRFKAPRTNPFGEEKQESS